MSFFVRVVCCQRTSISGGGITGPMNRRINRILSPFRMHASRNASERFPELLKHQTAENRLASIAEEREKWWHEMRDRHAKLWRKARHNLKLASHPDRGPLS